MGKTDKDCKGPIANFIINFLYLLFSIFYWSKHLVQNVNIGFEFHLNLQMYDIKNVIKLYIFFR